MESAGCSLAGGAHHVVGVADDWQSRSGFRRGHENEPTESGRWPPLDRRGPARSGYRNVSGERAMFQSVFGT